MQAGYRKQDRQFGREELEGLMDEVFGGEVHAQRLASLTDGVDGVLHAASLGVRAIGQGLAVAQGLVPRHAIKQVDRLLSNPKLSMAQVFGCWVPFVVGEGGDLFTSLTELQTGTNAGGTVMQTSRARSPVWETVTRSEIKDQRNT